MDITLETAADKLVKEIFGVKPEETVIITEDDDSDASVVEAVKNSAKNAGAHAMVISVPTPGGVGKAADPDLPVDALSAALLCADVWIEFNHQWLLYSTPFERAEAENKKMRYMCLVDFNPDLMIRTIGNVETEQLKKFMLAITEKTKNAKNKMINSLLVANEYASLLPADETPGTTEGYEGFYHLIGMEGEVENTVLSYIVRDHDREKFEARKQALLDYAALLNEKFGEGTVTVELKDQYYNMRQQVEPLMHIIDIAFAAMQEAGVTPKVKAIRGGTDGAQLSFKGLPCPNIFAGGLNFHGRYEFVPVQSIEKAMNVVVKIS